MAKAARKREQIAAMLDARGIDIAQQVPAAVKRVIAEEIGISAEAVSFHLTKLRQARGVKTDIGGNKKPPSAGLGIAHACPAEQPQPVVITTTPEPQPQPSSDACELCSAALILAGEVLRDWGADGAVRMFRITAQAVEGARG